MKSQIFLILASACAVNCALNPAVSSRRNSNPQKLDSVVNHKNQNLAQSTNNFHPSPTFQQASFAPSPVNSFNFNSNVVRNSGRNWNQERYYPYQYNPVQASSQNYDQWEQYQQSPSGGGQQYAAAGNSGYNNYNYDQGHYNAPQGSLNPSYTDDQYHRGQGRDYGGHQPKHNPYGQASASAFEEEDDPPFQLPMPMMEPIRRMYHVYEDNVRGFAKRFRNMIYAPFRAMG